MYKVLSVVANLDSNPSSTRVFVRSLGIPPLFEVREGKGSLTDSGQRYFFCYDLDSGMGTENKTNTPIC